MTIVSHSVVPGLSPAPDAIALLPSRAALIDHLAGLLPGSGTAPATLVVVGLLRRDDGWPTPGSVLTQVTALLAGGLRGDDWIARSGQAEFGIVLPGLADAAEATTDRLVATVTGAVPGVSACAGLATLEPGCTPEEVHRRATLSLDAARHLGPRSLIRYRGTR